MFKKEKEEYIELEIIEQDVTLVRPKKSLER